MIYFKKSLKQLKLLIVFFIIYNRNLTTDMQQYGSAIGGYELENKQSNQEDYKDNADDSTDDESLTKSQDSLVPKSKSKVNNKQNMFQPLINYLQQHPKEIAIVGVGSAALGFAGNKLLDNRQKKQSKDDWAKFESLNKKDLIKQSIEEKKSELIPFSDKEVLKSELLKDLASASSDAEKENIKKHIDQTLNSMDSQGGLIEYIQSLLQFQIKGHKEIWLEEISRKNKDFITKFCREKIDNLVNTLIDFSVKKENENILRSQTSIFKYLEETYGIEYNKIQESINQEQEAIKLKNQQNQQKTGAPQNPPQQPTQIPSTQKTEDPHSTDANQSSGGATGTKDQEAKAEESAKGEEAAKESSQAEGSEGGTDPKGADSHSTDANQSSGGATGTKEQEAEAEESAKGEEAEEAQQRQKADGAEGEHPKVAEIPKEEPKAEEEPKADGAKGETHPEGGIRIPTQEEAVRKIQRVYRAYKKKILNQAKKEKTTEEEPKAEEELKADVAEILKTEEESQDNSQENILKDQIQKALKEQILQSINQAGEIVANQNSNLKNLSDFLDLLPNELKEDSFESEEKKRLDDLLKLGIQQIFTKTKNEIMEKEKLLEEKDGEIFNLDTKEIDLFTAINKYFEQNLKEEASEDEVSLTKEEENIKDQLQRIKEIVQKKKESDQSARDLYESGKRLLKQCLDLEKKIKFERYQAVDIRKEILELSENNKNLTEKRQARKQEQIKLSLAELKSLYNNIIAKNKQINGELSTQNKVFTKKNLEYIQKKIDFNRDSDIRDLYAVELEKNNQRDDLDSLDALIIQLQQLQKTNQELIELKLKEIYEKEREKSSQKQVSGEVIHDANEDSENLSSDDDENQDDQLSADEEEAGEAKVREILNSSQVENIVSEEDSQHQRSGDEEVRRDEEASQLEVSRDEEEHQAQVIPDETKPQVSGDDEASQLEVRREEKKLN